MSPEIQKSDEEWRQALTPEQYAVLRQGGTERAFTGKYFDCHDDGTYHCAGCGAELFLSDAKYDSGCGWPSFVEPTDDSRVKLLEDRSLGMVRTEVRSTHGDSHLGHVFPDGPRDRGGLRYCINSASLRFMSRADYTTWVARNGARGNG